MADDGFVKESLHEGVVLLVAKGSCETADLCEEWPLCDCVCVCA